MAVSIIPKQASEPEFVTETYRYRVTSSGITNTFPNATPTLGAVQGVWDSSSSYSPAYGLSADVSKSGYTIAGIEHAYGIIPGYTSSLTPFPVVETILDGNTLKMKTRCQGQHGDNVDFRVAIKYVKN